MSLAPPACFTETRSRDPFEGDVQQHPPGMILFCIARRESLGRLTLERPGQSTTAWFKSGRVYQVRGERGVLGALDPSLAAEDDLNRAFGEAIRLGHSPDKVIQAATAGLGLAMARWTELRSGRVRFEPDQPPPPGSFPVEGDLLRMLDNGLRSSESWSYWLQWIEKGTWTVRELRLPVAIAQSRWGFDPLVLRLLNLARPGVGVEALLARSVGDQASRRPELLHRILLLQRLGVLLLDGTPPDDIAAPRAAESTRVEIRKPAPEKEKPAETRKPEDLELEASLRESLEILRPKEALWRLELDTLKHKPTPDEIGNAFRGISKRYHPDRFAGASPEVRKLANQCFSLVQEATEQLESGDALAEQWRHLECDRAGIPYVTVESQKRARISFKKAEGLVRSKEFEIAEAILDEAMRLDPTEPEYVHLHALVAFQARQMTAEDAVARLSVLKTTDRAQAAAILVTMGTILKASGAPPERYLDSFQKALAYDPVNREAEREIRLNTKRQEKAAVEAEAARPGKSLLGRLFSRGTAKS